MYVGGHALNRAPHSAIPSGASPNLATTSAFVSNTPTGRIYGYYTASFFSSFTEKNSLLR